MSTRDFLFFDESGDPGNDIAAGGSVYFAIGCLHVTEENLQQLYRHYCAFGYFQEKFKEMKSSRLSRHNKDLLGNILSWLIDDENASISVAYIDKRKYSGPYFQTTGSRPYDPVSLRNFLTRQLLERHFIRHPVQGKECELVFDQAIGEDREVNLRMYLRKNYALPKFDRIIQADSRYIPALQFADFIVHVVKEAHFGNPALIDGRFLRYVDVYDVSHPIKRTS